MVLRVREQLATHRYGALVMKIGKYIAGSLLATVLSEVTFLIVLAATGNTTLGTVIGWFFGAVPNYYLNRSWTWGRRGKSDLVREVLPYVGIILLTLVVASITTDFAQRHQTSVSQTHGVQVLFVGGVFLLTYGVMAVLRFVMLDRLFAAAPTESADATN